ncbi:MULTISPECIES: WhiB family transcriptional regulator [Dermacoccus]|uniref:Transcriptional regulator WhiB n=2 Tax=Dermacoccus TaxID=57495 RepID=A0A417Z1H6_9MICO|nr:WhiB family transcriptional regulator [Dermacoccus abyssi]RHW44425.1 WhiB family transcriptional regulator [Dermacoccus abyssi]
MTIMTEETQTPVWDENWAARAQCAATAPDDLFAKGAAQQTAKVICQRCPVVAECLADALDNRTEYGVWGGMTERERRALLRRRPDVKSWTTLFKIARADEVAAGINRSA